MPAQAASPIQFTKVYYNSPGTDTGSNSSLNAEYFVLKNKGTTTKNLYNWSVRDVTGYVYRFTSNFYLRAGYSVVVHTGKGTNTSSHRYWGRTAYVWNNTGYERATLRSPSGTTMDYCSWYGNSTGYLSC